MASQPVNSTDYDDSELQFEHDHVSSVYKSISQHFSYTRYKTWPKIEEFLLSQPNYSIIADIGCGNGKDAINNSNCHIFGCDICYELLTIAKSRGVQAIQADTAKIPIRSGVCDAVISIAVIHHLCSERRRLMAIRELARILKTGGKLLIYVWAFEQQRKQFPSQDVLIPWHRRKIIDNKTVANPIIQTTKKIKDKNKKNQKNEKSSKLISTENVEGEESLNLEFLFLEQKSSDAEDNFNDGNQILDISNNTYVSANTSKTSSQTEIKDDVIENVSTNLDSNNIRIQNEQYLVYMRYYHLFCENELKMLIEKNVRELQIAYSYYDHNNWCIQAIKL